LTKDETQEKDKFEEIPAPEPEDDKSIVTEERAFIPGYEKAVSKCINALVWVSIISIIIMLVITVIDVVARAPASWSLPGTYEYSKYLMVLVAAVALPYTALNDGHVELDMVVLRMPPVAQKIFGVINFLAVMFYAGILAVQNWAQAGMTKILNLKPVDVPFPQYPFYYIIAIGVALMLVVVLVKCVKYVRGVK
jgi:TRAP-type C4-dicarboxylate transport system permease small subunit